LRKESKTDRRADGEESYTWADTLLATKPFGWVRYPQDLRVLVGVAVALQRYIHGSPFLIFDSHLAPALVRGLA